MTRPQGPVISGAQRESVCSAVSEALGEAYDCLRVWSVWGCGTMCSDDFRLVAEDETRVAEIADAAITALHAAPAAPPEGCVYVSQELLADYNAMKRAQSTSDTTARERMAREMPWLKNYHQMPRGGANSAALCAAAPACQKCDGTGDVHRADGEWLGRCSCAAPPAPVGGADFSAFAKQQGYDLTTCAYHGSITTADGVGPATYWNDDTEHAWRGWANKPSAPVLSEDGSNAASRSSPAMKRSSALMAAAPAAPWPPGSRAAAQRRSAAGS